MKRQAFNSTYVGPSKSNKRNRSDIDENELKETASEFYRWGHYDIAVAKYTTLLEHYPDEEIYYGHRAACYMMLGDYEKAMADAKTSVRICPQYIEGHCQVIRCAFVLHDLTEMTNSVTKLRQIDPTNEILEYQSEKIRELRFYLSGQAAAALARDYVTALVLLDKAIAICPLFPDFKVKKAKYLVNINRFAESEAIATEILKKNEENSDAHWVLGMCLYHRNIEKSLEHFEESLRLCTGASRDRECYERAKAYVAQKAEGNKAYKSQKFFTAYQLYKKALEIDPQNRRMQGTLHFNRAQVAYKLKLLDTCIKACDKTLFYIPDHVKALMRRARCYVDRKEYAMAVEDLEKASKMESSIEVMEQLEEIKRLKASKKDHAILKVLEDASAGDILQAYQKLIKLHYLHYHGNTAKEEEKHHGE